MKESAIDTLMLSVKMSFDATANTITDAVGIVLPIALGVAGLFMAIRLGIAFFKTVAN